MRDVLLPVLLTGLLVGAAISFAVLTTTKPLPQEDFPVDTSSKLLASDPTFYIGKRVRCTTGGLERLNPLELGYRARTDLPYSVLFRGDVRDPLPPTITGNCVGRLEGGALLVVDCK